MSEMKRKRKQHDSYNEDDALRNTKRQHTNVSLWYEVSDYDDTTLGVFTSEEAACECAVRYVITNYLGETDLSGCEELFYEIATKGSSWQNMVKELDHFVHVTKLIRKIFEYSEVFTHYVSSSVDYFVENDLLPLLRDKTVQECNLKLAHCSAPSPSPPLLSSCPRNLTVYTVVNNLGGVFGTFLDYETACEKAVKAYAEKYKQHYINDICCSEPRTTWSQLWSDVQDSYLHIEPFHDEVYNHVFIESTLLNTEVKSDAVKMIKEVYQERFNWLKDINEM